MSPLLSKLSAYAPSAHERCDFDSFRSRAARADCMRASWCLCVLLFGGLEAAPLRLRLRERYQRQRTSLRSALSSQISMRPQDQKLVTDAVAASVAAVAVAAALGPKACSRKGGAFSSALVEQCRGLRYDVPYEVDATPSTRRRSRDGVDDGAGTRRRRRRREESRRRSAHHSRRARPPTSRAAPQEQEAGQQEPLPPRQGHLV